MNFRSRLLHHRMKALRDGEPVRSPLVSAAVFKLSDSEGEHDKYGRMNNPTWRGLEEKLSILEDASALIFPSGMAAIAAVFYSMLKAGDRILIPSDGYYTTRNLAEHFLRPFGVDIEMRPTTEFASAPLDGFKLIFAETPSNPTLEVCDLHVLAQRAAQAGALLVVDNTTASPFLQRPLDIGADISICSDTKVISGHSDALLGHVATRNDDLLSAISSWRMTAGAIPGALATSLVDRGLDSADVRIERMTASAMELANRLSAHPAVSAVRYPGLPTDPSHALAKAQMSGFGFIVSVTLASGGAADAFLANCPVVAEATSFGGVETSGERRARWGDAVHEGFIRLSVGCEPFDELWPEIDAALSALPR